MTADNACRVTAGRLAALFKDLLSKEYTTGKVLGHGFGPDANKPDYSYLKGDITQAYTDKVKEAKRSFVFLNLHATEVPAALIVFDKVVSSDPSVQEVLVAAQYRRAHNRK